MKYIQLYSVKLKGYFTILFLISLFVSPVVSGAVRNLNIRDILLTWDIENKQLVRRIITMSSKDFQLEWKSRCHMWSDEDFKVIDNYLSFSSFMAHNNGENSYLCYNPKTNKLSVAYREYSSEWNRHVIYVASEEKSYPIDIHKIAFGFDLQDTMIYWNEKRQIDIPFQKERTRNSIKSHILNKRYAKALKDLEINHNVSCLNDLDCIFDTIEQSRFFEFREYALNKSEDSTILVHCANISRELLDFSGINMAHYLGPKEVKNSIAYAIRVYEKIKTDTHYDSIIAQLNCDLAIYQIEHEDWLDVTTRDCIKINLQQAYNTWTKKGDENRIKVLLLLAEQYKKEHDYYNAETFYQKTKLEIESIYGQNSPEYAMILNILRHYYYMLHSPHKAHTFASQYIDLLNNLGNSGYFSNLLCYIDHVGLNTIYSSMQAEQEFALFKHCNIDNIRRDKMREIDKYYMRIGDWNQLVVLRKYLYEKEKESYLMNYCLKELIAAYHNVGDYENEEYYKRIWTDGIKTQYGEESEEYVLALLELCKVYQYQNNNKEAFKCADKALDIEFKGQEHYKILEVLRGCGEYAVWSTHYRNAEFCYKQIIDISEDSWGIGYQNKTRVSDLEPLVNVYLLMGDTAKAISTIQEIITLGRQPDGREVHNYKFLGDVALRLENDTAALACFQLGGLNEEVENVLYRRRDFNNAEYFIRHHFDSLKNEINQKIIFERESERETTWNQHNHYITQTIPHYCYEAHLDSVDYATLAYDVALFTKGYLLSTSQMIRNIIMSSENEDLKRQWRELLIIQDIITQPLSIDSLAILQERARYMEQQILKSNDELLLASQRQFYSWSDIKKQLKGNEVAIEFTSFYDSVIDTRRYCAVLLKKKFRSPIYIPLFKENDISSHVASGSELLYANSDVPFNIVWQKLIPYINSGEILYFAPDGILHGINIELLTNADGQSISDFCSQVVRVSSTRELIRRENNKKDTNAILYGGIQYDTDIEDMWAESLQYEHVSLLASRGIESDTINRGSVRYLPGTKKEIEAINTILNQHEVTTTIVTSKSANEESFKILSGNNANIIHIGTHGFYWSDSLARKQEYFSQNIYHHKIDPLNRCGLLFAGANTALRGNSIDIPAGVQDGILTAKEISLMDLRNANLVVLSACETGKGDITSDGVFGLQRAFKMAGTQTIIMSLWPVDDNATQLLMTEFYNNWIGKKQSKREAFRNAQNAVRYAKDEDGDYKYNKPIYWAGFIMLD